MHESISNFLTERIVANDFPSAVYLVAEKGEVVFQDALGYAVVEPERIEAKLHTIYDVASLTKPLITGLLTAMLIETQELELGRTTDQYLPEFNTPAAFEGAWDTSICELLCHSSLFPAWRPFYLLATDRDEVLEAVVREPINLEDDHVIYSDLNFLVLMFLIERIRRIRLDELANRAIFAPLGLKRSMFTPPVELVSSIAASEKGNEYEKQTCIEQGYLQPPATAGGSDVFRDYQIWGEVHDGNAYFMGGVAGHAGLFRQRRKFSRSLSSFCQITHSF